MWKAYKEIGWGEVISQSQTNQSTETYHRQVTDHALGILWISFNLSQSLDWQSRRTWTLNENTRLPQYFLLISRSFSWLYTMYKSQWQYDLCFMFIQFLNSKSRTQSCYKVKTKTSSRLLFRCTQCKVIINIGGNVCMNGCLFLTAISYRSLHLTTSGRKCE